MVKFNFGKIANPKQTETAPKATPTPAIANPDRFLHGTGVTKRVLDKQTTLDKKQETKKFNFLAGKQAKVIADQYQSAQAQNIKALLSVNKSGIMFDASQNAAIELILKNQYSCLIGAAGTGKTTIMREIVARLVDQYNHIDLNSAMPGFDKMALSPEYKARMGVPIAFSAFTGRASHQMRANLPNEYKFQTSTVHSMLGYVPEYYEDLNDEGIAVTKMRFIPTFTALNKLPYQVIFIDEGGMLPAELWNKAWDACKSNVRVVMIGDINQLPPVMGRSALGFAMLKWPVAELTTIHRQKMPDGDERVHPIIAASQAILKGSMPPRAKGEFDLVIMPDALGAKEVGAAFTNAVKRLHKQGEFDPLRDTIIVPTNVHQALGKDVLNESFVTYFNAPKEVDGIMINRRHIIQTGKDKIALAAGDKIMFLENDRARGLTNGMIGIVEEITLNGRFNSDRAPDFDDLHEMDMSAFDNPGQLDFSELDTLSSIAEIKDETDDENQRQASHVTRVVFEGGADGKPLELDFSTAGQYKKLTHAYCVTCHKSQGGEYHTVVILAHSANSKMLTREWLYTAVTRGKTRVILVCNLRGLNLCLQKQSIKGKTLEEKIKSFNALMENNAGSSEVANIPDPKLYIEEHA